MSKHRKLTKIVFYLVGAISLLGGHSAFSGEVLKAIKKRGYVQCGVNTGLAGFGAPDSKGNWRGMDVDTCRAIAIAVFGDASKVKFTPLSAQQRFTALQSKEVDVLVRNTTWTLSRDTSLGLNFVGVSYYDGQGFMVKANSGIKSAKELSGATICVQPGTTTELNLADYFRAEGMKFKSVVIEDKDETFKAFMSGRCDVYTTDVSGLAAERSKVTNPESLSILPEIISKEPLGPAVRHGDDQWFDTVKWTLYALVAAEEMNLNSKNVEQMKKTSTNPTIKRFLGVTPSNGKALKLAEDWAFQIVKQVGNYGEIFERNVGANTPLKLKRGLNALWVKGGLMYAPPFK